MEFENSACDEKVLEKDNLEFNRSLIFTANKRLDRLKASICVLHDLSNEHQEISHTHTRTHTIKTDSVLD